MPQTYTCPRCGPISHLDVVETSDFDVASSTLIMLRTCERCGANVKRVA